MKLILTVGAPGSGKSFWAKATSAITGAAHVERDAVRKEMNLPFGTAEKTVETAERAMVREMLAKGHDVIVANVNLSPKNRAKFIEAVSNDDTEVWYKLFTDVEKEKAHMQNVNRASADVVPPSVIDALYRDLIDTNKFADGITENIID